MNDDKNQALLLDEYLESLRQNPNARPPAGLEPSTAQFARHLIGLDRSALPSSGLKDRLWQQLASQARPHHNPTNSSSTHEEYAKEIYPMLGINSVKPSSSALPRWRWKQSLPIAAAFLGVILFGIVLLNTSNQPPNNQNGLHASANQSSTNQQSASHTATSTIASPTPTSTLDCDVRRGTIYRGEFTSTPSAPSFATQATMSNTIMPTLDLSDCDNESTLTYRGEFTSTPSATPFATQATMSNTTATPLRLEDSTPSPAPLEPTMPNITATPFQGFSDIDPTPSLEVTPTAIPSQPNAAYTLETYTAFGLRDYQGNPENLALGESSTGNLNAETPVYMYRLEATKGQLLELVVTSESPTNNIQISYAVIHQDNTQNAYFDDSNQKRISTTTNQFTLPLYAQENVEIWVLLSIGNTSHASGYSISLQEATSTPISYDETFSGEWEDGMQSQYFSFEGEAGDIISVAVEAPFDTDLLLDLADSNFALKDKDSGAGYNPELSDYQLRVSGTYYLILSTIASPATQENRAYTLSLNLDEQAQLAPSEAYTFSIYATNPAKVLTFNVEANQRYRLTAQASYILDHSFASINIVQDEQSVISGEISAANQGLDHTWDFVAPADGILKVLVNFPLGLNADLLGDLSLTIEILD